MTRQEHLKEIKDRTKKYSSINRADSEYLISELEKATTIIERAAHHVGCAHSAAEPGLIKSELGILMRIFKKWRDE